MNFWKRVALIAVASLMPIALAQAPAQAGPGTTTHDGPITRYHYGDIDIASVTHVVRVGDNVRVTVDYQCPPLGPNAQGDDWLTLYIDVSQWRAGRPHSDLPDSQYILNDMFSELLRCDNAYHTQTFTVEPNLRFGPDEMHPLKAGTAQVTVSIDSPPDAYYSYVNTAQEVTVTAPHLPEVAWVHNIRQASSSTSHYGHSGPNSAATMRILYRCWDNPYGVDPTMIVDLVQDRLAGPGGGYHRFYSEWFGRNYNPQPRLRCTGSWRFSEFKIYQWSDSQLRLGSGQVEVRLFGASGNVVHEQRISVHPEA